MRCRFKYILSIGFFGLLFSLSCRHDDPVKADPCKGKTLPSADFTVDEYKQFVPDSSGDEVIDNTIGYGGSALFRAKDLNCDTYTWIIGDHVDTLHGKEVSLEFEKPYGRIPVTLIVTKKVDKNCFPGKSDTAIKKMDVFIVDYPNLPIAGRYRGAFEDTPQDTFTIKIGVDTIFGLPCSKWRSDALAISNFPCPGYSVNHLLYARGASFLLSIESRTFMKNPLCLVIDELKSTYGYLKNGKLIIPTQIQVDEPRKPSKMLFKRFIGTKIH